MIGEKIVAAVLEKGIPLISKFVKDKDLASKMEQEWRLAVEENRHELDKLAVEVERDIEQSFQETVRAELQQNDTYTKRTRPLLARRSAYAAAGYIMFCLGTQVINVTDILIDWSILTVMASPMLTYMGVRSFDKWRAPSS